METATPATQISHRSAGGGEAVTWSCFGRSRYRRTGRSLSKSLGYSHAHYKRFKKGTPPDDPPLRQECSIKGCRRIHHRDTFCDPTRRSTARLACQADSVFLFRAPLRNSTGRWRKAGSDGASHLLVSFRVDGFGSGLCDGRPKPA